MAVQNLYTEKRGVMATYSLGINSLAIATTTPTDICRISGSASKLLKILQVQVSALQTTAGEVNVLLIKRSTANTGGTSTTPTPVPHDSLDSAASSVVAFYTANPTALGTSLGIVNAIKLFVPNATTASAPGTPVWDFSQAFEKPLILRGVNESLVINLNGVTAAGATFNINITWTEE
jgi:hypothetical protein